MRCIRLLATLELALVLILGSRFASSATIKIEHISSIPCKNPDTGELFVPLGIDILADRRLIVVDGDNSLLWLVNPSDSTFKLLFDCSSLRRDCRLVDVAVDFPSVICSENKKGTIIFLDLHGEVKTRLDIGKEIGGIATSRARGVFACVGIEQKVLEISQGFSPLEIPLGDNASYPIDCCSLSDGRVLVTDAGSGRIISINPINKEQRFDAKYDFKAPWGIGAYQDRYLVVSDPEIGVIAIMDLEGNVLGVFGLDLPAYPTFLACASDGLIYVSDQGNMSIEVLRIDESQPKE